MVLDSAKFGHPSFALSKTFVDVNDVNTVASLLPAFPAFPLFCLLTSFCFTVPMFSASRSFHIYSVALLPAFPACLPLRFPLSVYLRFATCVILFQCSDAFASFPLHRPIQWRDVWAYFFLQETTLSFQVYPVTFYSTVPSAACHCFPCTVLQG